MRYKNNSKFKILIQLENEVKEILPNQIFSCPEILNYGFLKKLKSNTTPNSAGTTVSPTKKYKKRAAKKKKVVEEKIVSIVREEATKKEPIDGSDKTEG